MLSKYLKDYAYILSIALVIVLLDQYTKWLVQTNLSLQEAWAPWPWIMPYARFVHWTNVGAAFGMFNSYQVNEVFAAMAVLVSIAILVYFPRVPWHEWSLRLALSMQLGGAVGNLVDRIRIGHVVDFVSVGNFAVFNVADASISVGVAILIATLWFKEWREQKQNKLEIANQPIPVETQLLNAETQPEDLSLPVALPVNGEDLPAEDHQSG